MAQVAIDAAKSTLMLNALLPVGAAGIPGTQLTALPATAMSGSGYVAGGIAGNTASAVSSAGSNVTLPATPSPFSWTFSFAASIVSLELTDGSGGRVWYGNWNGQPIAVASGNTFAVAVAAIQAGGF